MKISVAHATRRPAKALEIRQLWLAAAAHPEAVEWIFGIDEDDAEACRLLANEPHTVSPAGGGGVRAFNAASAQTTGEIIISGCDDVYPIPRWDEVIVERFAKASNGVAPFPPLVLLTGDGHRTDRLATHIFITRAWYDRFGFMFPPKFRTVGPDVWLTERAARDGCLVNALDLNFEHRHPFYHKVETDSVYEFQNNPANYELALNCLAELLEPLPISLCMITGNEIVNGECLLTRCLDRAAGAFDELCLVRAIGTASPDETVELAQKWCAERNVKFHFAEYANQLPCPHCDDFAAARNLSFSLATQYWCLWLDADDSLDAEAVKNIREASAQTRFEGQRYRYVMPTGGEFFRERLIKRGLGVWSGTVHETCSLTNGDFCDVKAVAIRHEPPAGKDPRSAARNLRILEATPDKTPRQLFYHHEELLRAGKKDAARVAGLAALEKLTDQYPAERYEICLNLAELAPDETEHWAFEAIKLDPLRREALSQLVQAALHAGEVARAIIYFRWMDSIPVPNPKPWTHRNIWHGWARNYLRVLILRAGNNHSKAAAEHAAFMADPEYAAATGEFEAAKILTS
jgi:hypothetical protein